MLNEAEIVAGAKSKWSVDTEGQQVKDRLRKIKLKELFQQELEDSARVPSYSEVEVLKISSSETDLLLTSKDNADIQALLDRIDNPNVRSEAQNEARQDLVRIIKTRISDMEK